MKEFGLFKFAHHFAQAQQGGHVVLAEITLGQGMPVKGRGAAQIQHQIELSAFGAGLALKVNGASHTAGFHAIAVRLTRRQINLVIQANGLLWASGHAGIAAGAQVQVNGVAASPLQVESTQPTTQTQPLTGDDRVAALLGRHATGHAVRHQGDVQAVAQHIGQGLGAAQLGDDEQTARAFVSDRGHRLGIGHLGLGQQGGDFGHGLGRLAAPTRCLADVHKLDGHPGQSGICFARLLRQVFKQTLFLGARHHQPFAAFEGRQKALGFAPAQTAVQVQ